MEVLGTTKPHICSFFIELPSIYPWHLVARHNQTCAGIKQRVRVPSSLGKMRLGWPDGGAQTLREQRNTWTKTGFPREEYVEAK